MSYFQSLGLIANSTNSQATARQQVLASNITLPSLTMVLNSEAVNPTAAPIVKPSSAPSGTVIATDSVTGAITTSKQTDKATCVAAGGTYIGLTGAGSCQMPQDLQRSLDTWSLAAEKSTDPAEKAKYDQFIQNACEAGGGSYTNQWCQVRPDIANAKDAQQQQMEALIVKTCTKAGGSYAAGKCTGLPAGSDDVLTQIRLACEAGHGSYENDRCLFGAVAAPAKSNYLVPALVVGGALALLLLLRRKPTP